MIYHDAKNTNERGLSPEPYFQNLVGEHSVEGDPISLYNLTKSDPDHLF